MIGSICCGRKGLLALAGVFVAGAGVWFALTWQGPSTGHTEKIILGAETIPFAAPVWVAEHEGYFRDEGVEVEVREFDSGRTALFTMLDDGGIDLVTAAQTPVILKSFGPDEYAIVAGLAYSDKDVKVLARRDRGIMSPGDLKGKIIGITAGSSGHFFLSLFLAYHHLQLEDVTTMDLEATRLGEALIEGRVDAVATWEPHVYRARKALGSNAVLLVSNNIYREDFYFVARQEFIQQHPEALKRFLRAIRKGEEFIRSRRAETLEIVRSRLDMNPEVLNATWDELNFGLFLEQGILASLEDEARWAMKNELAGGTRMPNFLKYLHTQSLLAVKPEAVTIAGMPR